MQSPATISTTPSWHIARAKILHRVCLNIKAAKERGVTLQASMRQFSRYYNGRILNGGHRLKLSVNTMRRVWDDWKREGELPVAFELKFRTLPPRFPASVMIRLVDYCAGHSHKSLRAACLAFASRPKNQLLNADVLYWAACRYFRVQVFKAIQAQRKAIAASQAELARLRVAAVADIRNRLPARVRGENHL